MKHRVWVFLDIDDIKKIEELIKDKKYDSMSQFIRRAVIKLLEEEIKIKIY